MGATSANETVTLDSHLDVRNIALVRPMLHAVIDTADSDVVLDLSATELIDAAGLGMLTAAHLRAERAGHHLILRNCHPNVRRMLAVTRLNRLLHVERQESLSA